MSLELLCWGPRTSRGRHDSTIAGAVAQKVGGHAAFQPCGVMRIIDTMRECVHAPLQKSRIHAGIRDLHLFSRPASPIPVRVWTIADECCLTRHR